MREREELQFIGVEERKEGRKEEAILYLYLMSLISLRKDMTESLSSEYTDLAATSFPSYIALYTSPCPPLPIYRKKSD